jgi:hypothetical protein
MSPLARRIFSSKGLIGTVVIFGLIMSGISLYMSYSVNATPSFLRMNISTYDPPYPGGLRVVLVSHCGPLLS